MSTVNFNGTTTLPGTKTVGAIEVTRNLDGSPVRVPYVILNGVRPGPKVWLLAGIHGDEIEAIVAVQNIIRNIDPQALRGAIIAILAANPAAVSNLSRESPQDHKDLNRVFPGDPQGSFTERLAHILFSEILKTISEEDVILNLHGGGRTVLAARLIEVRGTGDEHEERSVELARVACNPNLRIVARVDEQTGPWATTYRGTLLRELYQEVNTVRLTIEAGGLGRLDSRDIRAHYNAIYNVLCHSGLVDDRPTAPQEEVIFTKENVRVAATKRGLWIPHVEVGEYVKEQSTLAQIVDIYGQELEVLRSPFDGIVLYLRGYGVIDPESASLTQRYGANVGKIVK